MRRPSSCDRPPGGLWALGVLALGLLAALVSCGGDTVNVDVNFPSQETFLRSESARVFRFKLREDQRDLCPNLLRETALGQPSTTPDWDSGLVPICDLHEGLTVPVDGSGWRAFIVLTENEADQVLLAGCTVTNTAPSGVTVRLAPTPTYVQLYVDGTPAVLSCKTTDEKCETGCD